MKKQTSNEVIKAHGQAFGVKTEKEGWYGQEVQTKPASLIDPGTGKPYILRFFEFAKNPLFKGLITNQEIFNHHWRQIQVMLWSDGLVAAEEVEPRFKMGKRKYKIVILCKPRLGVMVADKVRNLKDVL